MSSMCPSIVVKPDGQDGKMRVAFVSGAAGGSRITSGTAYVLARMMFFNEDPKVAGDAFRIHHQLLPEELVFERETPRKLLDDLRRRGHINQTERAVMSVVQSIKVQKDGQLLANADFRRPSDVDGL